MIRSRIHDDDLKVELKAYLSKGIAEANMCYEELRKRFKLGRTRFFTLFKTAQAELAQLKIEAQNRYVENSTKKAIENGLRTKSERLLFLQNEIDEMEKQLRGEVAFTWIHNSKILKSHSIDEFNLPVQIQNELRRLIRDYQSEISKLEGEYAPAKTDITSGGEKIQQTIIKTADGKEISI